jgi:DNA-binding transcriptional ArsR family regulator
MTEAADSGDVATPLKVLSLSDLKDLQVGTVWDVMEQLAEREQGAHPTLSPPRGQALPGDVSRNYFSEKPARRKKLLPPPEPPEWALEGTIPTDGPKVMYALIPSRAIHDKRIRGQVLAVLGCLCMFTSRLGVAYPNQKTMARILGIHPTAVCRAMRSLREAGYVRLLVPVGKRRCNAFRRGNRYQVLVCGHDQMPPKGASLDEDGAA